MGFFTRCINYLKRIVRWKRNDAVPFSDLFVRFHQILEENNLAMEMIAEMESKLGGDYVFDRKYLKDAVEEVKNVVLRSAYNFHSLTNNKFPGIYRVIEDLSKQLQMELSGQIVIPRGQSVLKLEKMSEAVEEAVGNKVFNLVQVEKLPQTNVPPGFVVTITGFRDYLAYNDLFHKIKNLLELCRNRSESVESISNKIRLLILGGDIPPDLRREILRSAETIWPKNPEAGFYSVRSSAVGEDGDQSFAGLHDSFLNVRFRELLSNYKKVLAGMYNPAALEYRLSQQITYSDMAMAVLYQRMVPSRVAGVVYTIDPLEPQEEVSLLTASWGLGKIVVEGRGDVDTFRISRTLPYPLLESKIGKKKWMIGPLESEQIVEVSPEMVNKACLNPAEASSIIETALILERFFKRPLDVEWSIDNEGRLWILQARPLILAGAIRSRSPELKDSLSKIKVLMKNQGVIAYRGVGAGPVWLAEDAENLDQFPSGAVLVIPYGLPVLARAIPRASAVITDVGSPTGHMATVAREFRIPTIVATGSATEVLKSGQEVTVDAERNVIYEGRVNQLLHHQLLERASFETTGEFQLLRRLLKRVAPLNLIDPENPNFTAENCRTFHDVMRFIHEKSIQHLIQIAEDSGSLLARGGKRLKAQLPLNLILIDIGGGLDETVGKSKWVFPEQITSIPMKALLSGMSSPDAWSTAPISADFKGLMSSLTRTRATAISGQPLTGLNMAVLGANYMNLTLRVGYHFTVIDASVGEQAEKNSIFFRFIGGAADISRRSRRASLLSSIIDKFGFKVEGKGDIVIARTVNFTIEQSHDLLYMIGRLLGFVRQLDVLMTDDAVMDLYFERFMSDNEINRRGPNFLKRREVDDQQINNLHPR